jgi:antitoxin PrlF
MSIFSGSITTTGKSEAIRLDKALFRLHPEFRQKAKVRAQVIAPGQALISVVGGEEPADPSPDEDPIVAAFLGLLEQDMRTNPQRIAAISRRSIARASRLTKRVKASDRDRLPRNVSF